MNDNERRAYHIGFFLLGVAVVLDLIADWDMLQILRSHH